MRRPCRPTTRGGRGARPGGSVGHARSPGASLGPTTDPAPTRRPLDAVRASRSKGAGSRAPSASATGVRGAIEPVVISRARRSTHRRRAVGPRASGDAVDAASETAGKGNRGRSEPGRRVPRQTPAPADSTPRLSGGAPASQPRPAAPQLATRSTSRPHAAATVVVAARAPWAIVAPRWRPRRRSMCRTTRRVERSAPLPAPRRPACCTRKFAPRPRRQSPGSRVLPDQGCDGAAVAEMATPGATVLARPRSPLRSSARWRDQLDVGPIRAGFSVTARDQADSWSTSPRPRPTSAAVGAWVHRPDREREPFPASDRSTGASSGDRPGAGAAGTVGASSAPAAEPARDRRPRAGRPAGRDRRVPQRAGRWSVPVPGPPAGITSSMTVAAVCSTCPPPPTTWCRSCGSPTRRAARSVRMLPIAPERAARSAWRQPTRVVVSAGPRATCSAE
jgi:hypothetical protein